MNKAHSLDVIANAFDLLERFNFVKENLAIGWGYMADYYGLSLEELETTISNLYFDNTFISTGIGNQDFFIADNDHATQKKVLLSLVEKGVFEIDSSNEDGDTFYYSFYPTQKAIDIYNDLMFKYDILLSHHDRDHGNLDKSYTEVIEQLNVLLDDIRVIAKRENLESVNEYIEQKNKEELQKKEDEEKSNTNSRLAQCFEIMVKMYGDTLSKDYEDVKIGHIEGLESGDVILHCLVDEGEGLVRKNFMFFGDSTEEYIVCKSIEDSIEDF